MKYHTRIGGIRQVMRAMHGPCYRCWFDYCASSRSSASAILVPQTSSSQKQPAMASRHKAFARLPLRLSRRNFPSVPSFHAHLLARAPSWRLSGPASSLVLFSTARSRSDPRTFPTQGFDVIDKDQPIEEEGMPEYNPDHFYPVHLGEVFNGRFQTVAKLGYGSSSTIWLARDLECVPREKA